MKAGLISQLYSIGANVAGGSVHEYGLAGAHRRVIKSICHAATLTTGADATSMKFKAFGFCAIILAEARAYSALRAHELCVGGP